VSISYIRQCVNLTSVDDRYEQVEGTARTGTDMALPTSWTTEDVESWLMVHAAAVSAGVVVDTDTDLFAQGFDRYVEGQLRFVFVLSHSIRSVSLRRSLKTASSPPLAHLQITTYRRQHCG
jgi:hypothetical protein